MLKQNYRLFTIETYYNGVNVLTDKLNNTYTTIDSDSKIAVDVSAYIYLQSRGIKILGGCACPCGYGLISQDMTTPIK